MNFSNAHEEWTEEVDILELLGRVLAKHGHASKPLDDGWLEIGDTKISVKPAFADGKSMAQLAARTCTTIRARHPIVFPDGVFEYQHSTGANVANSLGKGYEGWVLGDLPALLNALSDQPKGCTFMDMEFPAKDGRPARRRRAVLGPIAHFRQHPVAPSDIPPQDPQNEPGHDFCPCCFLTRSVEAFKPYVEHDAFFAIRMYAMRSDTGEVAADCRINGQEFEEGKAALRRYVSTWPHAGFEFRKQYVVIQSLPVRQTAPTT